MKALFAALISTALLLGPAVSFAQSTNSAPSGTARIDNSADTNGIPQPVGSRQSAASSQAVPASNIDYGMPADGTSQYGRPVSRAPGSRLFGHH